MTGGIGSGKSTVCRILSELGCPVYNADDRAKQLMHNDDVLKENIKSEFGASIYSHGQLNRQALADIVFADSVKLEKLNGLVHPAVAKDFTAWCDAQESEVVIKEAAILFETGGYKQLDETVLVHAPKDERITRVCARDGVTPEQVESRMDNQWSDEQKRKLADHIIENHNGHLIILQVLQLIESWNR